MARILLRAARMDEAELLGELALRSKAYWGYDQSFLNGCREELTFQPEEMQTRRIVVAKSAGHVLGFYSVDGDPPQGELGNLWVDPFALLRIGADPHAEGFYLAMGAQRVGETPSGSIPGRVLPLLRYDLGARLSSSAAMYPDRRFLI